MAVDPNKQSARQGGLVHVSDSAPGLRRKRAGKGFAYVDARGRTVRNTSALQRIRSLAIPPAWTDVWICARADGHIQATGRDARGRKQHRYHSEWTAARNDWKYGQMIDFAHALPAIRKRVHADLKAATLSRAYVLATVVKLLEKTLSRL